MTGSPVPNDTVRAWGVCGLLLLATMLNYMDRQALAVTLPTLKAQYQLAEGRVGVLEGCFGIAFAFGSLLFGWLADRFGPRFLYPAVLAGWSLAGVATSYAGKPRVHELLGTAADPATGVYHWLLGCRILLGVCEAGHWPCALLTVRALLSTRNRTLGNGILQSGASIGAIVTPLYIEATEQAGQSWEFPFWSIGLAGLVWVPLWFAWVWRVQLNTSTPHPSSAGAVADLPRQGGGEEGQSGVGSAPAEQAQHLPPGGGGRSESRSDRSGWGGPTPPNGDRREFVAKLVILAVIVGTLTISWQFLRAWLGLFLQDHLEYTKHATRRLMAGYFVASDVGCILSGVLVAALVSRGWVVHSARRFGFLVFTLLTGCGAVIPFVGDGWLMVVLLFLTGAGILGLHPYYYSLTQEISGKHMGVLSGGLAASGWIVSSVSQILLGKQIEATKSYQLGLVIVGLAPLIGLIALVLFWPKPSSTRPA